MSLLTGPLTPPVLLPFSPDWTAGVVDEWEWMTDILTSESGAEQRIRLRSKPRRYFSYRVTMHSRMMRAFDGYMFAAKHLEVGIPVWFDRDTLTSAVSSGTGSLTIDTTDKDYHTGGYLLFWAGWSSWEMVQLSDVTDTGVTFSSNTTNSWHVGTEVIPVRVCRLEEETKSARVTGDICQATIRAVATDFNHRYIAVEPTLVYKGYPVLTDISNWAEVQDESVMPQLDILDYNTGPIKASVRNTFPLMDRSFEWFLNGREAVKTSRSFMMAREGRRHGLWVPTWANDLSVAEALAAGGTTLKVIDDDYQAFYDANLGKKDLFVMHKNGSICCDRILSAARVGNYQELTLEHGLSFDVDPNNVAYVSFMGVHRLIEDRIKYAWYSPKFAKVKVNMRLLEEEAEVIVFTSGGASVTGNTMTIV